MTAFVVALSLMSMSLSSCYISRVAVGSGPIGKDKTATTYSTQKDMFLFWGLLPLTPTNPKEPTDGNYQVQVSTQFVDWLVTRITGGIFGLRTVKVLVKGK